MRIGIIGAGNIGTGIGKRLAGRGHAVVVSFSKSRDALDRAASAIGGGATHWGQLIPVYVLPGLIGSALAALAYDALSTPRRVAQPIEEAVTHPDPLADDAVRVAAPS